MTQEQTLEIGLDELVDVLLEHIKQLTKENAVLKVAISKYQQQAQEPTET